MKTTERSAGLLISGITSVEGPIIRVEDTGVVAYDEFVEIIDPNNQTRVGRVLELTFSASVPVVLRSNCRLIAPPEKLTVLLLSGFPAASSHWPSAEASVAVTLPVYRLLQLASAQASSRIGSA